MAPPSTGSTIASTQPMLLLDQPSVAAGVAVDTITPGTLVTVIGGITNGDGDWAQVSVPDTAPTVDLSGLGLPLGLETGWVLTSTIPVVNISAQGPIPTTPSPLQMWWAGLTGGNPSAPVPTIPGVPGLSLPSGILIAGAVLVVLILLKR